MIILSSAMYYNKILKTNQLKCATFVVNMHIGNQTNKQRNIITYAFRNNNIKVYMAGYY